MHPKPYSAVNIISNSVIGAIVLPLVNHDASQRLLSPAPPSKSTPCLVQLGGEV